MVRGEDFDDAEFVAEGVLHDGPVDGGRLVALAAGSWVEAGWFLEGAAESEDVFDGFVHAFVGLDVDVGPVGFVVGWGVEFDGGGGGVVEDEVVV